MAKNYDGEPKGSAGYEQVQKNPIFRREMKRMIEAGFSKAASRPVAAEAARKPK